MAFLEKPEFCDIKEYNRSFNKRVKESDLQRDELYTMMRFKNIQQEAGKISVRALEIEPRPGLAVVKLALLDADLKTCEELSCPMTDGTLINIDGLMMEDSSKKKHGIVTQAYMKSYDDGGLGVWLADSDALRLVGASN